MIIVSWWEETGKVSAYLISWKDIDNKVIIHRLISVPTITHNIGHYDKLTKLGIPIIQTTSQTFKTSQAF